MIEESAVKQFKESLKFYEAVGRYEVGLPWKSNATSLVDNYEQAFKRLQSVE